MLKQLLKDVQISYLSMKLKANDDVYKALFMETENDAMDNGTGIVATPF